MHRVAGNNVELKRILNERNEILNSFKTNKKSEKITEQGEREKVP